MDRHSILEPRAQQRVHVRVCGSIRPTMLVDRENTLRLAQGPAKGLIDGVAQDARAERWPSSRLKRSAAGLSTVKMKRK